METTVVECPDALSAVQETDVQTVAMDIIDRIAIVVLNRMPQLQTGKAIEREPKCVQTTLPIALLARLKGRPYRRPLYAFEMVIHIGLLIFRIKNSLLQKIRTDVFHYVRLQ